MNAIVNLAIGENYERISVMTRPSIEAYAKKIGAEFVYLDQRKISKTTPHWEKFQIYDLLNKYERIIYLDADLIVREDCPNLFELVPSLRLGAFNEARFTDRSKELLIDTCKQYGATLSKWNGAYYNTGVMVISRRHKSFFKKPEKEISNFFEQTYLNMVFAKEEDAIMMDLDYKFNRMTCMDQFTGEERHASYIIHYAGFPNLNFVMDLIPRDLEKWERDKGNYNYKRHIYVSVTGGYGDQIAAEPAVRFMREELYPKADFVVATHWPRLFEHFKEMGVTVCKQGGADLQPDTPYFIAQTLPGPDRAQWAMVSHLMCHTVDYASIALMKRTLPIANRRIKFKVRLEDYSNLFDIIGAQDLTDMYAVHPGKHWNSKTFPVSYWQGIIDGLVAEGKRVCVIGKDDVGDHPFYVAGARGTVDVKCPEGVYDLRNLLDLGGLAALLSQAKVLISNDSFPIHLAGAFDNWIVLIPSCKHQDHILPWRNGSMHWKSKVYYHRLTLDDVESRPTQMYETSAEIDDIDWTKYLVDPVVIVSELKEL